MTKTVIYFTGNQNRQLEVKEDYAAVKALVEADTQFIEVTQVHEVTKFKSPVPNDTKPDKVATEVKHLINKTSIATVQPIIKDLPQMF